MKHLTLSMKKNSPGFTIIELLVVVVIIAIIASITTAVYIGVTKNAHILSLKSDLSNASETLKVFKATHGSYPTTISCSTGETSTNTCVKASANNTYTSYASTATAFSLIEKNNPTGAIYEITDNMNTPIATMSWASISAAGNHNCAISLGGKAYCWGYGGAGQLGNNSTANSSVPVAVNTSGVLSGKTVSLVSAHYYNTCAISSDGKAYCWGMNNNGGQLGNNSTSSSSVPVAVNTSGALSGKVATSIATGFDYACALTSEGKVDCWGWNAYGQLGNNSTTNSSVPIAVDTSGALSGKTITSIAAGYRYACALASDGKAYCWGDNTYGQLGNNSTTNSSVPIAVDTSGALSGKTITSIAAGYYHACALTSEGKAYCWGSNNNGGQLGNNSMSSSLTPVAVNTSGALSGKVVASIAAGGFHSCARTSDGKAYCWGNNYYGQLGNSSTLSSSVPVAVDTSGMLSGKTTASITTGQCHTCALASDGKAYCWGDNAYGQLGNNSTTNSSVPVVTVPASI